MEFRRSKRIKIDQPPLEYQYPLQLYLKPPTGDISLEEFESFTYDRLKVLQILEQASLMGHRIYSEKWKMALIGYLKKEGLRKYVHLIQNAGSSSDMDDAAIRKEDHISHFILRLCYCRSLDMRNWFIAREVELFKLRFSNLNGEGLRKFIKACKLPYSPMSEDAKQSIKEGLLMSTVGYNLADVENKDFYKVPFQEVSDLVSRRLVYIKGGYAYVPSAELVSCLVSMLRSNLNEELVQASKVLPCIDDPRVISLLQSLNNTYTGKDYTGTNKKEKIDLDDLESFSLQSFPLCMRTMYEVIKQSHHIRHYGRLQFGLFLKGIGLTLDDAITYWKREFTKLIDEDKFNKEYLYNIKHSYGRIGKMTNYTPYSCTKVITCSVGPGEHHGCPFKHWDLDNLRKKMVNVGLQTDGMKDILNTVKTGHYQIACSKYFIQTHGGIEPKVLINHPNQYFEESREIRTNSREKFDNRNVNKKLKQAIKEENDTDDNDALTDDDLFKQYLDSGMDWDIEVHEGSTVQPAVKQEEVNMIE